MALFSDDREERARKRETALAREREKTNQRRINRATWLNTKASTPHPARRAAAKGLPVSNKKLMDVFRGIKKKERKNKAGSKIDGFKLKMTTTEKGGEMEFREERMVVRQSEDEKKGDEKTVVDGEGK